MHHKISWWAAARFPLIQIPLFPAGTSLHGGLHGSALGTQPLSDLGQTYT